MHSSTPHPRRSVFVVDRDDGVDLDRDEADERREAGLDGERGEGAEAEHGHQRIEYQTLREKKKTSVEGLLRSSDDGTKMV